MKIDTHSVMTAEELFEMGITVPEPKAPRVTGERVRVRIEFTSSPEWRATSRRREPLTGAGVCRGWVATMAGDLLLDVILFLLRAWPYMIAIGLAGIVALVWTWGDW